MLPDNSARTVLITDCITCFFSIMTCAIYFSLFEFKFKKKFRRESGEFLYSLGQILVPILLGKIKRNKILLYHINKLNDWIIPALYQSMFWHRLKVFKKSLINKQREFSKSIDNHESSILYTVSPDKLI